MTVAAGVRSRCRMRGRRKQPAAPDRGASAVELAILAPALLIATMLIIQFALWFEARHAALAAAQAGARVARAEAAISPRWQADAQREATQYYDAQLTRERND